MTNTCQETDTSSRLRTETHILIVVADQMDFTHRTNAFVIHEDDDD